MLTSTADTVNHSGNKVLLFCKDGVSQSVAVAIGYLMKRNNWCLRKAFEQVVEQRPWLLVEPSLMRQLMEMESVLFPQLRQASLPISTYLLFFNRLEDLEGALAFKDVAEDPLPAATEAYEAAAASNAAGEAAEEREGEKDEQRDMETGSSAPSTNTAEGGAAGMPAGGGGSGGVGGEDSRVEILLRSYSSSDFASEDLSAAVSLDELDGE